MLLTSRRLTILVPLFLLLALSPSTAVQVQYCCVGTSTTDKTVEPPSLVMYECDRKNNVQCSSVDSTTGSVTVTRYSCVDATPCTDGSKCCSINNCNCPVGVHKTSNQVGDATGDMRKIMFPVMGLFLGLSWVVLVFIINIVPHVIMLTVVALINIVFGIFLIFIPVTTFLGLYFIALGAFSILVIRNGQPHQGMVLIAAGSFIAFLIIGGLTFVANNNNIIDQVQASVANCENELHIENLDLSYWNLNTRCENWLLFTVFSVYLLFLVQPITLLNTFYMMYKIGNQQAGYSTIV